MEIRNSEPSRYFHATGGGAGLNFEHLCGHGRPAFSFHLLSEHGDSSDDIGILLPSCAAPALFGAAIAYFEACHGSAAREEFMAALLSGKERAAQVLEKRRANYEASTRACCQAGFFTQGREHTCGKTS